MTASRMRSANANCSLQSHVDTRAANTLLVALPFLPLLSARPPLRALGYLALAITAALLATSVSRFKQSDMFFGGVAISVLAAFGLTIEGAAHQQAITQILQLGLIGAVLFTSPLQRPSRLGALCAIGVCIGLTIFLLMDFVLGLCGAFQNPNMYGSAGGLWVLVVLKVVAARGHALSSAPLIASLSLPLSLVLVTTSRASIILVLIACIWMCLAPQLGTSRLRLTLAALALALPMAFPIAIYDQSLAHTNTEPANVVSPTSAAPISTIPSRTFWGLSSRDVIWSTVFHEIESNRYAGRGLGRLPGEILTGRFAGLSAHNGFMQLLYQFGAAGLLVFSIGCWLVITSAAKRPLHDAGLAIFVGGLMHETFEVALTQNNFGFGLGIWLLVALPAPGTTALKRHKLDMCA